MNRVLRPWLHSDDLVTSPPGLDPTMIPAAPIRMAALAQKIESRRWAGSDISKETGGSFSPRIQECYERWDELLEIAATLQGTAGKPLSQVQPIAFGNPAPQPR